MRATAIGMVARDEDRVILAGLILNGCSTDGLYKIATCPDIHQSIGPTCASARG